jgi:hypothetical protein
MISGVIKPIQIQLQGGPGREQPAIIMVACDEHQMQTVVTDAGDTKFSIRRRDFNQKKKSL